LLERRSSKRRGGKGRIRRRYCSTSGFPCSVTVLGVGESRLPGDAPAGARVHYRTSLSPFTASRRFPCRGGSDEEREAGLAAGATPDSDRPMHSRRCTCAKTGRDGWWSRCVLLLRCHRIVVVLGRDVTAVVLRTLVGAGLRAHYPVPRRRRAAPAIRRVHRPFGSSHCHTQCYVLALARAGLGGSALVISAVGGAPLALRQTQILQAAAEGEL